MRWSILALLGVAQFMVVLDISIVNVALPSIGSSLKFAPGDLQWVVTTYVLCSGGLLLLGGRLADLLGRRRTFLAGLLLFTGASLAAGLAPSSGALIAARAVQGVGASLLTPSALAIVTTTYTGERRATALSVWGLLASAGIAVGVLLGGVLTTVLSWHWVFLVNVPVGLATAVLTPRIVPPVEPVATDRALDVPGALTGVGGLVALVYGVSHGGDHGWGSAGTIVALAVAAVALTAFLSIERAVRRPMLPPAMWRVRSLSSGAVMMLGVTGILGGAFFLTSVYVQRALGWSALESGLAFLPFVVATATGVHVSGHVTRAAGTRATIVGGMGVVAAGALLLALGPDRASYAPDLLPGLLVLGVGVGTVFPAVSIAAMSEVEHETAGVASGLMNTAHEIGAALGVAVLSTIAASGGAVSGFGDGFAAAAIVAAVLGVAAAASVPSVRPAAGAPVSMH
jgi:EmrB/QacA subfamily drug resistance transporter